MRLVADLDVVFLAQADHRLHELQLAIRTRRRIGEVASDAETPGRWLRSPEEAAALFADRPETLAAASDVATACQLDLGPGRTGLLAQPGPAGEDSDERLRRRCQEALEERQRRGGTWTEDHARRLEAELGAFAQAGFSGFLQVVAEILAHCREQGIVAAARGSAVSSLTLHLLGGSPVDPLEQGLLFERFLHAGKSAWPDVDLDLPWHRRDEVIDWVYRHFGRDRVAMVAAHHAFQRRLALREGLKAWAVMPKLIETLARRLPPEDLGIEEFDFLGLARTAPSPLPAEAIAASGSLPDEALPLVQRLVGRPHHVAAHPGGIVIGRRPIEDVLPLDRAPKGVVITQYDLTALAELGFAKIDLLGSRCLSELEETLALAGGEPRGLGAVPAEDPVTLALVDRAETVGCFQLESPAMRSLLVSLPIRSQADLVAALALIRPGAAAGEAKAAFLRRARGEEPEEPIDPAMADWLGPSHGLLLYEEDIMRLFARLGGLSLGEADELRSAIVRSGGDPEKLAPLEAEFVGRARARLGEGPASEARAHRAWAAAARFAAYSFTKAHAASYGQLAYLSAFMKAHHPLEFGCALLNHHQGFYPLRTLASEMIHRGIALRLPHVNRSAYRSRLEEPGEGGAHPGIRVGLDKVKHLSLREADDLLGGRARSGSFGSLQDLLARVRFSDRAIRALLLSGACDGLLPLAAEAYPFVHEAVLRRRAEGTPAAALADWRLQTASRSPAEQERFELYQGLVRVQNELRYLEMHLTAHPLALLRREAARYGCRPLHDARLASEGTPLRLAATVAALRRVAVSQGVMEFLTLEDETGLLEAVVLPPAYRRLGQRVTTPGPFLVEGRLRRLRGAAHLEVEQLSPFKSRERPFGLPAGA